MNTATCTTMPQRWLMRALLASRASLGFLWRSRGSQRSLRVKESVGLGERRFVAVVQYERQQFLIGGGPGSVTLLAQLKDGDTFGGNPENA